MSKSLTRTRNYLDSRRRDWKQIAAETGLSEHWITEFMSKRGRGRDAWASKTDAILDHAERHGWKFDSANNPIPPEEEANHSSRIAAGF